MWFGILTGFDFRGQNGQGEISVSKYLLVKCLCGALSWKLPYKSVVNPMCLSPHPPQT